MRVRVALQLLAVMLVLFLVSCGKYGEEDSVSGIQESPSTVIQEETGLDIAAENESTIADEPRQNTASKPETGDETTTPEETLYSGEKRKDVPEEEVRKALSEWKAKGDNDYYIVPDSSTRLLTEEELSGFSKTELRLVRNEIAARHGWDFDDPVIKSYFITQKWYEPAEGKNDQVQFDAVETANIELIDKMESREEKPVDYRRLNQLTELKPEGMYEFSYGENRFTLESTHHTMTLYENGKWVKEHYNYDEATKVLVYNRKNESILIFSERQNLDFIYSEVFLINQNGAKLVQEIGGTIRTYTGEAVCSYFQSIAVDNYMAYEWLFLQEDKWVPKGKEVTETYIYTAKRQFVCYAVEKDGFSKVKVDPGETLYLVSVDDRSKNVLWVELKLDGQLVLLPYFKDDEGFPDRCEDGAYPFQYFEETQLGPAG